MRDYIVGRIFPNGEFGVGRVRTKELPDLGSSNSVNSHSELEPRAKRGTGGITSHGRKMVRNGAFILEHNHDRQCLAFLTWTLPTMTPEENKLVCEKWSEIVRQGVQNLRRRLISVGLPGDVVGCVEIQPGRASREGGLPLHLHLIFQCKKNKWMKGFPLTPQDYRDAWKRAVIAAVPEFRFKLWKASENVQVIQKSAEGYLGKYLSKGIEDMEEIKGTEWEEFLPSCWYVLSKNLRRCIIKNTRYGEDVGQKLLSMWNDKNFFQYQGVFYLPERDGQEQEIGRYGRIQSTWFPRLRMGLSPSGVYEVAGETVVNYEESNG